MPQNINFRPQLIEQTDVSFCNNYLMIFNITNLCLDVQLFRQLYQIFVHYYQLYLIDFNLLKYILQNVIISVYININQSEKLYQQTKIKVNIDCLQYLEPIAMINNSQYLKESKTIQPKVPNFSTLKDVDQQTFYESDYDSEDLDDKNIFTNVNSKIELKYIKKNDDIYQISQINSDNNINEHRTQTNFYSIAQEYNKFVCENQLKSKNITSYQYFKKRNQQRQEQFKQMWISKVKKIKPKRYIQKMLQRFEKCKQYGISYFHFQIHQCLCGNIYLGQKNLAYHLKLTSHKQKLEQKELFKIKQKQFKQKLSIRTSNHNFYQCFQPLWYKRIKILTYSIQQLQKINIISRVPFSSISSQKLFQEGLQQLYCKHLNIYNGKLQIHHKNMMLNDHVIIYILGINSLIKHSNQKQLQLLLFIKKQLFGLIDWIDFNYNNVIEQIQFQSNTNLIVNVVENKGFCSQNDCYLIQKLIRKYLKYILYKLNKQSIFQLKITSQPYYHSINILFQGLISFLRTFKYIQIL